MKFTAKGRDTGDSGLPDRRRLVAAARAAFDDLGPDATVDGIARRAGISAAVIHRQFRDRDELVDAVLDDLIAGLRQDEAPETTTRGPAAGARLPLRYTVPPLAVMAALLPLAASPGAVAAEEPAPATVLTVTPLWPVLSLDRALGGSICEANGCTTVPYLPFSTPSGVNALDRRLTEIAAIGADTGGSTIVFAFSNGAGVAEQWLTRYAGAAGVPTPDELSFVLIGNPRRAYGGTRRPTPPTDYQVIDIVRQYDPMADFPDNPFNLLALANVAAGMLSPIHLDYTGVDINDPANYVWTEGNTTYVFVPTENLPLLNPLRLIGLDKLADALNEPLKEIVERAYDRYYLPAAEPVIEAADTVSALSDGPVAESVVVDSSDTTSDRTAAATPYVTSVTTPKEQEADTPGAGPADAADVPGDPPPATTDEPLETPDDEATTDTTDEPADADEPDEDAAEHVPPDDADDPDDAAADRATAADDASDADST